MGRLIDLTGEVFGGLVVLKLSGVRKDAFWECECSCGRVVEIRSYSLRSGRAKSCGCARIKKITKHNLCHHPLYRIWASMKSRCFSKNNVSFMRYGGRGIKVCEEWANDFRAFFNYAIANGWGSKLQIDRKDNNGDYCPENCRFVTQTINNQNAKRSKIWVINGVKYQSLSHAKTLLGVSHSTIRRMCGDVGANGNQPEAKPGCWSEFKYKQF